MLFARSTIALLTPSNCIGTRLLTPTKLNAGFSIILHSMLFPPLTFTMKLNLGNTLCSPLLEISEGKKPHQFLNARVNPSID